MDISIIIPVYNVEDYLTESLESVRKNIEQLQAEVFLIDDGSTDGSTEIAKFYAESCEKFKYYRTENTGPSCARNLAISMASGKYMYFMDADDILVEDILLKMFRLSEKNKTDLTMCNVARIQNNKVTPSGLHVRAFYNLKGNITHISKHPNFVYDTTLWNKLILRSFFMKHELSFLEGYRYADIPVTLAMHHYANGVSVLRQTGYLWRVRNDSDSEKQITKILNMKSLTDRIDILKRVLNFTRTIIADPAIEKALQIKILDIDFNLFVDKFYLMEKDEALAYMKRIAAFINTNIDKSLMKEVPIKKRQANEYILQGDYEHLVQAANYKTANYSKAPVIETKQGLQMVLPESIFSLQDRSIKNEFINTPPSCYVDFVKTEGAKLSLFGHCYYWRISTPEGSDQHLKAALLNETTGESVPLDISASDCSYLTNNKGMLLNYDDYTYYNYNYNGAGFQIDVDFETLTQHKEFLEDSVIMVSYENIIDSGETLLRGAGKEVREAFKGFTYVTDQCEGTIGLDKQNIVLIHLHIGQTKDQKAGGSSAKRTKDTLIIQKLKEEQRKYREEQRKYNAVCNSKSYKLGRVLTWLPRKIRDML